MKNLIKFSLFLCFSLSQCPELPAEIEKITIRWSLGLCTPECAKLLKREFDRVPGVAEFNIDQPIATAVVKWTNKVPFSFQSFNVASRLVGLSFRDIRFRVTGTLSQNGNTVTLTSTGDNTRFELVQPAAGMTRAVANNLYARRLQPELLKKLNDAEQQKISETIEGPLFMPGRSETLYLSVDNLSLNDPSLLAGSKK